MSELVLQFLQDEEVGIKAIIAKFHSPESAVLPVIERLTPDDIWLLYMDSTSNLESKEVVGLIAKSFACKLGVNSNILYSAADVLIPVESLAHAESIRPQLKANGFSMIEVFLGAGDDDKECLYIKGSTESPFYPDNDGISKGAYGAYKAIGLDPQFVFGITGTKYISADFELTLSNVTAAIKLLGEAKTYALHYSLRVEIDHYDSFCIGVSPDNIPQSSNRHREIDIEELRTLCEAHQVAIKEGEALSKATIGS